MDETNLLVSGIDYKVKKLVQLYSKNDTENQVLKAQNKGYREQIEEQKQTIKELKNEIKSLKIAKTLAVDNDNSDARKKINELVREIDKCISLLNN